MKHFLALCLFSVLLSSCDSQKSNLTITGKIDGLRKGKLYLQKVGDSSLINVDSLIVSGASDFIFETYVKEPEVMFIELDRNDGDDYPEVLSFFAEPGEIQLTTSLKNYGLDLEVISEFENQKKLEEFNSIVKKFNDQKLDLIEANFEASKNQDEKRLDSINDKFNSILKRKYLYTINFALNNKELEVSPYVMLAEAFDANMKYLDTVYNSLDKPIKKSLYGKRLEKLIENRKKNDEQNIETEVIDEINQ